LEIWNLISKSHGTLFEHRAQKLERRAGTAEWNAWV
jgi:hypothetical protein